MAFSQAIARYSLPKAIISQTLMALASQILVVLIPIMRMLKAALNTELVELPVECGARHAKALRDFAQVSILGRERNFDCLALGIFETEYW